MQNLYRKISDRRYEKLKDHEFSGFPFNGIWIVSGNHQQRICSISVFSTLKTSFLMRREVLVHKLLFSGNSVKECVMETFNEPFEEKEIYFKATPSEIIYEKKNDRYKKYGEVFRGFPYSGIWEVHDGKNNGIYFLGHFSDFPDIDVDSLNDIEIIDYDSEKTIFEYAGDVLNQVFQEYEKKLQNRG